MAKLRETCAHCGKAYTADEMAARREERRQNALNGRAKAEARGNTCQRKRRVDPMTAYGLWLAGKRVSYIAGLYNVSISSVYRALELAEKWRTLNLKP